MTDEDYGKINLAEYFVKKTDLATTVQNGLMSAADKIKLDNLQNIEASINWNNITNKPNSFTPSNHTHQKSDITDFNHSHGDIDENGVISNGNSGDILILGVGNRITSSASIDANKIQNLKTINNESIVGSGNITISGSGEQNVFYGVCHTMASTQTKLVYIDDDWSFTTGNVLFVKFINGNSYNGTAIINIDEVKKDIATVGTTKESRYYWQAGEVVGFIYDGSNMVLLEGGTASTTYYGITKLSSSTSSTSETLSATPKAVKTAYDLANSKQDNLVSGTNIKTINNQSLLGNGNIDIQGGGSVDIATSWGSTTSDSKVPSEKLVKDNLDGKAPNVHTHDDGSIQITDTTIDDDWGVSIQSDFNTEVFDRVNTLQTDLDLKINTSDIANNLTTTTSGKVLDARQGKALADNKADSIHTHTVSDVTDIGTVELLVNYTDGTSETIQIYKQNSS